MKKFATRRGRFYKFVTADRVDVLRNRLIRFTQPSALNDPFESFPSLREFKKDKLAGLRDRISQNHGPLSENDFSVIKEAMSDVLTNTLMEAVSQIFLMLCMTERSDNLLMWSHYADSHRGFVIGFDTAAEIFAPGNLSVQGICPVQYSEDRLILPQHGFLDMNEEESQSANTQFFFTKSPEWSYEREYRLLAMPTSADKVIDSPEQPKIYLFGFAPDAIQEVTFGYRMPHAKSVEIADVVRTNFPNAELWQMHLSDAKFALERIPYDEFDRHERRVAPIRNHFRGSVEFGVKPAPKVGPEQ